MSSNTPLVLLTGASGHVGFAVLVELLGKGYNVRIVLRDASKKDSILSASQIRRVLSSSTGPSLSFSTVPDMTRQGAFESVLQNVDFVVHCASPINRGKCQNLRLELVEPAVKGTVNLLKAAQTVSSIRRVVITSSNSAIINYHSPPEKRFRVTPTNRQGNHPSDIDINDADLAYSAGKIAALNATDAFVSTSGNLHFDVISIMPTYVFGPKGLAKSPEDILDGSNIFGIGTAMVKQSWGSLRVEAVSCHVLDVAQAHVRALSHDSNSYFPRHNGTHRSCILAAPYNPANILDIIKRKFPAELWEEDDALFGGKDVYDWYHIDYDTNGAESLLGRKLEGLEEQIYSTALQVLDCVKVLNHT